MRILGEVLHREIELHASSNDEAREQVTASMLGEYVDALFDFDVDGSLDESEPWSSVEDVLGRLPRSSEDWVREHIRAFV